MKKIIVFLSVILTILSSSAQTIKDFDGNSYATVKIGSQIWMAENLKTTKLNNGVPVNLVDNDQTWSSTTLPSYCWLNNSRIEHAKTYGAIYNWQAVETGKLCPEGWRVPTNDDFNKMITFLGGKDIAGGKLKESGTQHWLKTNELVLNELGFSAVPAGFRFHENGYFVYLGKACGLWTSTFFNQSESYMWVIVTHLNAMEGNYMPINTGASVRCLKN